MSRSTIAEDYELQLTRHLQEDLNRRLQQVDGIITRPEMALMMINISTSMFLGAQTFVAANAEAGTDVAAALELLTVTLADRVRSNREKVLRTAAAIQRGERPGHAL